MRHTQVARKGLVILWAVAAGGCASARVAQFHSFAEAGRAYVKASQVVLDEAGTAAIDADSVVALRGREALDASGRRAHLIEQDKLLATRLLLLKQIGRHGRLLESYFDDDLDIEGSLPSALAAGMEGGMDRSAGILNWLRNWSTQEQFTYSHEWSIGDLVIWDNTGTMHRAEWYDHTTGRMMVRTKLEGEEGIQ